MDDFVSVSSTNKIKTPLSRYDFNISIKMAHKNYNLVKLVTLSPRYILINDTKVKIKYN